MLQQATLVILVLKPTSCDYRRLFAVPNIRLVHFNLVHNALVRTPLLVIGSAFAHLLFFQKSCMHILAQKQLHFLTTAPLLDKQFKVSGFDITGSDVHHINAMLCILQF